MVNDHRVPWKYAGECVSNVLSLTMISYSPHSLKKTILKDKYIDTVFEKGRGREIYLVGGYVRDTLRRLVSSDRDFVVSGDLKSFVDKIRNIIGGTVVQFKKDNMIRIALHEGLTFDFSRPAGTLREDLSKRDFTVNAIAWSPDSGIVDYFHGLDDLSKKRIRAISEENIISDPLRMIRAYRFAAELSGSIENRTRKIIKSLHGRIKKVSPERITLELFTLLNSRNSSKYLKMGLDDGILSRILLLPFKKLENNIREIYKLEKVLSTHPSHRIKVMLNEIYAQNLTNKGLLCLETLLQDGYADPKTIKNLRLSNRILKHINSAFQGIKLLGEQSTVSGGALFDLFMKSEEASRDILIIKSRSDLLRQYEKFKRIWKRGLLTSEEIIHISNLKADPRIGKIIEKVKKAQFEEKIRTKKQAVDFIRELVTSSSG